MKEQDIKMDGYYQNSCPVIYALSTLSKKWFVPIICELNRHSVMRFSELQKAIKGITSMMLTQSLKELQSLGIVNRIQYNEMPLRVEYSLSEMGTEMLPSIFALSRWSVHMMNTPDEACICDEGSCPAHIEHIINIKQSDIGNAYQKWDDSYQTVYDELNSAPETRGLDPIDKMIYMAKHILREAVECGEELSRLRTIYYIIGDDKSEDLLTENRPAYRVMSALLAAAREQNIVTEELSNDEIIRTFMQFLHGMIAYWELERGAYDILEKNEAAIRHFVNSFRKFDR